MEKKQIFESFTVNGSTYQTILTDKFKNRTNWKKPDPKMIEAYIPGTINKIFVKEGQKVRAGAKLLILEAMKMKNLVVAPLTGVVKSINVVEGDMVPKRKVVIELE